MGCGNIVGFSCEKEKKGSTYFHVEPLACLPSDVWK